MDFGNLEETLLNEGKEKGRELAENFLDEQQARQGAGTLSGTGIGIGKSTLENYLGDKAAENPRAEEEMPNTEQNSGGAATAEMSANADDSDDDSNDDSDDSNDADNSDDADSDEANDDDAQTDDADDNDSDDSNDENGNDDDSDNDDDDSETRNNR